MDGVRGVIVLWIIKALSSPALGAYLSFIFIIIDGDAPGIHESTSLCRYYFD